MPLKREKIIDEPLLQRLQSNGHWHFRINKPVNGWDFEEFTSRIDPGTTQSQRVGTPCIYKSTAMQISSLTRIVSVTYI